MPLTLADRRLYNYLLHNALDHLSKRLDFVIPLAELAGVYGSGAPPADRLKESLRRLIRTLIEFELPNKKWVVTSLLDKAELDEAKAQLNYSYPLNCRQLFTDAFTLERCLIQAHFTLKYSNLLYEILAAAFYTQQTNYSLEIADLRGRLQIAADKLTNFSDFDRFTLMPAIDEINSYASFAVKYDTTRKGMKVTHVVFTLTGKNNLMQPINARLVLPPKRPRLFIDDPATERAYAHLLNAETKERRRFFDLARKKAAKKKQPLAEELFDRVDTWFRWVA